MSKRADIDAATVLRDDIAEAVAKAPGINDAQVKAVTDAVVAQLQLNYGGTKVYIPTPGRTYPVDQILDHLAKHHDVDAACAKFALSRRTLFRLIEKAKRAA